MKYEFETAEYEMTHGAPRGRGNWAFEVDCDTEQQRICLLDPKRHGIVRAESLREQPETVRIWTRGGTTYSEAKAQVKLFLRVTHSHAVIMVCP